MREKLRALTELQKIDLEIVALQKAADVHPKQMGELERELSAAWSATEAERNRLADLERQKQDLEQNIAAEKEKVKKWEARLAEQRSTREYAALAREIDIAKKANTTMAEQLVELARTQAAARETVRAKEAELLAQKDQIAGQIAALREKMGSASSDIQVLEERRKTTVTTVDANLLRRYETVRKRRSPALVTLESGTCQGCNMNVPAQLFNSLLANATTDICPSCGRIIYAGEALRIADST